jgi:hypothetical protein
VGTLLVSNALADLHLDFQTRGGPQAIEHLQH